MIKIIREREIKLAVDFSIARALFEDQWSQREIGGLPVTAMEEQCFRDAYFDTPEFLLWNNQAYPRIRRLPAKSTVTFRLSSGPPLVPSVVECWPEAKEWLKAILEKAPKDIGRQRAGRPGLSRKEWIERLAKVQKAKEMMRGNPDMRWKEARKEVGWHYGGTAESNRKLFEDALYKLRRLEKSDRDGLLQEAAEYRKGKERKEM